MSTALALGLGAGSTQAGDLPQTIPSGVDLFETDPIGTYMNFGGATAIPAGFFDPGSDQFSAHVPLSGVPLEAHPSAPGANLGDADTIVRRTGPIELTGVLPRQDTVPIEIIALHLVSMEPINVFYGGQSPEKWDVDVTLGSQQQPPGQATVMQPNNLDGGTLQFQLPVLPLLTFTRHSDGATRTLDLRTTVQPTDYPNFTLQANNIPWRSAGCDLPALRIPTVNETFCPGLTPGTPPAKSWTGATAPVIGHGFRPVQPSLEHFKCYALEQRPFQPTTAAVQDQFGSGSVNVLSRRELCNPVRKNQEPFVNAAAHLQCYETSGPPILRQVRIRNQLGAQTLNLENRLRLCLPTEKRKLTNPTFPAFSPLLIDHFSCYGVANAVGPIATPNPIKRVNLRDQFGKEKKVRIGAPERLCAPAEKNNEQDVQHPVKHLVCYRIKDGRKQRDVRIRNQFEERNLRTKKPTSLCVPSDKLENI